MELYSVHTYIGDSDPDYDYLIGESVQIIKIDEEDDDLPYLVRTVNEVENVHGDYMYAEHWVSEDALKPVDSKYAEEAIMMKDIKFEIGDLIIYLPESMDNANEGGKAKELIGRKGTIMEIQHGTSMPYLVHFENGIDYWVRKRNIIFTTLADISLIQNILSGGVGASVAGEE